MTATTTETLTRQLDVPQKIRDLRPAYFDRLDTLLASGAVAVQDDRKTHPPTGRTYAD